MTRPLSKSAGRWLQVGCWQGVAAAGTLAHWSRPIFTEVKKDEKTRKKIQVLSLRPSSEPVK